VERNTCYEKETVERFGKSLYVSRLHLGSAFNRS